MPKTKEPPALSFIGIVDFSEDAVWLYCSGSVTELLGWEPAELVGTPSIDLTHPDESAAIRRLHYDTISQDKAAVLAYLRLRHKDPLRGHILCCVSRTIVHTVTVGSVSFAQTGPKAMHNASTAQEVQIISPTASNFQFRKWNDPSPMPPCHVPDNLAGPSRPPVTSLGSSQPLSIDDLFSNRPTSYPHLAAQSPRTLLILNRFSTNCNIEYCSNDCVLPTTAIMGRPFYDFVTPKDESLVRSWIDTCKSWGVNERGQPSDGGFGFGKFRIYVPGRDSRATEAHPPPSKRGHEPYSRKGDNNTSSKHVGKTRGMGSSLPTPRVHRPENEFVVDVIFSAHSDGLMAILRRA